MSSVEHAKAVSDFMSHPKIDMLLKKLLNYYMENIRNLIMIDM